MKKPVALIIMDGFGESNNTIGNAVKEAKTPNLDRIEKTYPTTLIKASGLDVGEAFWLESISSSGTKTISSHPFKITEKQRKSKRIMS